MSSVIYEKIVLRSVVYARRWSLDPLQSVAGLLGPNIMLWVLYDALFQINLLLVTVVIVGDLAKRIYLLFYWYLGKGSPKPGLIQRIRSSWVQIPAGVGITVLAILQWRRLEKERNRSELKVAKDWEITCYRALPLRSLSRIFGWASETYIPVTIRPFIYNSFAKVYGVNLDEMAESVDRYSCLSTFFTRRLKDGVRPIDSKKCLVSPADGMVLNSGKLNSFNIEQVKGVTYSITTFLGDVTWNKEQSNNNNNIGNGIPVENGNPSLPYRKDATARRKAGESWAEYKNKLVQNPKNELYQCVVYLAPGDYHRFHSPVDWEVTFRRHFQGELLSVNPKYAKWIPNLFALNERVVYVGNWEHGYFSMTAVGATNVGSIRVYNDKSLHTNTTPWEEQRHRDRRLDCKWSKGEEVGEFRMGSTLVLIFEAPPDFKLDLPPGTKVKVGRALTSLGEEYLAVRQENTSSVKPT